MERMPGFLSKVAEIGGLTKKPLATKLFAIMVLKKVFSVEWGDEQAKDLVWTYKVYQVSF